jgi:hypothetical protein
LKVDDRDDAEGWPSPVEGVRLEITPRLAFCSLRSYTVSMQTRKC